MRSDIDTQKRIGVHYFPDTFHYRERDLYKWLPELKKLGINWITLFNEPIRAIPEYFIRGLIESDIEPIIHIRSPIHSNSNYRSLKVDFDIYSKWGVKYVSVFDRPNIRKSWSKSRWTQTDLVERFLDIYLPIASDLIDFGLTPVLPPLEPGGDFWDTSFLRLTLRGIKRRAQSMLIEKLAIGAYAWFYNRTLNWGSGGPEYWPKSRPYFTPSDSQDQIGFRIFDWYTSISKSELDIECPILILACGDNLSTNLTGKQKTPEQLCDKYQILFKSLNEVPDKQQDQISIPNSVKAINFWLLSAHDESPYIPQAWFKPDGRTSPVINVLRGLNKGHVNINNTSQNKLGREGNGKTQPRISTRNTEKQLINHYLLLPLYSWGAAEWDLDFIRPFIQQYQPTVGFSLEEAKLSKRVTVAGRLSSVPDNQLEELLTSGCVVDRLDNDGTILAIN